MFQLKSNVKLSWLLTSCLKHSIHGLFSVSFFRPFSFQKRIPSLPPEVEEIFKLLYVLFALWQSN